MAFCGLDKAVVHGILHSSSRGTPCWAAPKLKPVKRHKVLPQGILAKFSSSRRQDDPLAHQ